MASRALYCCGETDIHVNPNQRLWCSNDDASSSDLSAEMTLEKARAATLTIKWQYLHKVEEWS